MSCDLPRPKLAPVSNVDRFVIWFIGDSTQIQTYWAFFCGLVRLDARVLSCSQSSPGHYSHPGCGQNRTLTETSGFTIHATLAYGGTQYVLKMASEYAIADAKTREKILGGCASDGATLHEDCPDFVLFNRGLHVARQYGAEAYEREIRKVSEMIFDLPIPVRSRMVWRETLLQHFPGPDGSYSNRIKTQASTCQERVNISHPSARFRQHHGHIAMMRVARERGEYPIPFISLAAVEANSGHLFPWSNGLDKDNSSNLDCTHRVYTPLYYDAVFDSIANAICGYAV